MKDVERVNALNKMLLNANVVAYGAIVTGKRCECAPVQGILHTGKDTSLYR